MGGITMGSKSNHAEISRANERRIEKIKEQVLNVLA
jgi:uncharacterized protein YicC (UPF0701 family)